MIHRSGELLLECQVAVKVRLQQPNLTSFNMVNLDDCNFNAIATLADAKRPILAKREDGAIAPL